LQWELAKKNREREGKEWHEFYIRWRVFNTVYVAPRSRPFLP
jgi:hypothetical protein